MKRFEEYQWVDGRRLAEEYSTMSVKVSSNQLEPVLVSKNNSRNILDLLSLLLPAAAILPA